MIRQRWTISCFLMIVDFSIAKATENSKKTAEKKRRTTLLEERGKLYIPPKEKRFTQKEKDAFCRQYKNQIVSYYRTLYRITNNCQKIKILEKDVKNYS